MKISDAKRRGRPETTLFPRRFYEDMSRPLRKRAGADKDFAWRCDYATALVELRVVKSLDELLDFYSQAADDSSMRMAEPFRAAVLFAARKMKLRTPEAILRDLKKRHGWIPESSEEWLAQAP